MKFRRHRRLVAVLLAVGLTGAQWLLGRSPAAGSLCGAGSCFAPAAAVQR